jgi:TctA family transporter
MTDSLRGEVGRVLPVQVAWAILSTIWNVVGVYLIAQGQRAIGPTASVAGAVVLMAIAVGFVVAVCRWPIVHLLLTIAAGLLGLGAVVNAFSADRALWPSEFWRYAGAVLNSAGFVASAFAVVAFFRWKSG